MDWRDERIEWKADGKPVAIGLTRFGTGPAMLLPTFGVVFQPTADEPEPTPSLRSGRSSIKTRRCES